jgi:hypothetical protein
MFVITKDGRLSEAGADLGPVELPGLARWAKFEQVRRKPVIVEAMQMPDEFQCEDPDGNLQLPGKPGDYLMRGVEGEYYCCSRSVFQALYEKASDAG